MIESEVLTRLQGTISAAKWSRPGGVVASLSGMITSVDARWNARSFRYARPVLDAKLIADGHGDALIGVADPTGVALLDSLTGSVLSRYRCETGQPMRIDFFRDDQDQLMLVYADDTGGVTVWQPATGLAHTHEVHRKAVHTLHVLPGARLVVLTASDDRKLVATDLDTGIRLAAFGPNVDWIEEVVYVQSRHTHVLCADRRETRTWLWNGESVTLRGNWRRRTALCASGTAFGDCERPLFSIGTADGVWLTSDDSDLARIPTAARPVATVICPAHAMGLVATEDGRLISYRLDTDAQVIGELNLRSPVVRMTPADDDGDAAALAASDDGAVYRIRAKDDGH